MYAAWSLCDLGVFTAPTRRLTQRCARLAVHAAQPLHHVRAFHHAVSRVIPYSREHVFDTISDVQAYQQYLPFCLLSNVLKRTTDGIEADMIIGFGSFTEKYTSKVFWKRPESIEIRSLPSSLFKRMQSNWIFESVGRNQTLIKFDVDMQVRSPIHAAALNVMFTSVAESQVRAFVSRCKHTHSTPNTEASVLSDESMPAVRQRIKQVLDWDGMADWGSVGRFNNRQAAGIRSSFLSNSRDARMDVNGFSRMCAYLSHPGNVFELFRECFFLDAFANDTELLNKYFAGFSCDEDGRIDETEPLVQIYFLSKAEPFERLVFSLFRFGDLDMEVSQSQIVDATEKHFKLQMEVMRSVMPKMVLRQARGLFSEKDANFEGVFVLGAIGAMETALQETEKQLFDRVESLSTRLFSSSKTVCTVRDWALAWQEHQELVDTLNAPGMSQLINWVTAVDAQRPFETH